MSAFSLSNVVSSDQLWSPLRVLVYGEHGLGKTTFGCSFEKPILLRIEDGIGNLEVPTFPHRPATYDEMVQALEALHQEDHAFQTLVVDSLDWLEDKLLLPAACAYQKISTIEEIPYGKGWAMVDKLWMEVLDWLDALRRDRGMTIVCVAHAAIKRFDPPDGEPYDRFQIKLQKRSNAIVQEWADIVHLLKLRTTKAVASKDVQQSEYKATSQGERVIISETRPAHQSKNRYDLPEVVNVGKDKTYAHYHRVLHDCTKGRYPIPSHLQPVEQPA